MKWLRTIGAIFYKDLLSEFRRREYLNSILFFALLIIFLFSFALGTDPKLLQRLAPGLLWLVILFSTVLALERSFYNELDWGCLDGLLLYSSGHRAIFLGKLLANLFFMLLVEILVTFFLFLLFGLPAPHHPEKMVLVFFLGNIGIATLGTFYAALCTKTRARQVLLPLLLFPMLVPLLLGAVHATQYSWEGDLFGRASSWLYLMSMFDLIFLAGCLLAIEPLLEA